MSSIIKETLKDSSGRENTRKENAVERPRIMMMDDAAKRGKIEK